MEMHPLVKLAKLAVEIYIRQKETIDVPLDFPEDFLRRRSGTFVTITKNGELRGCIGTYLPTRTNIAQEVISNAIAAATQDYRFGPIKEKELPDLSYTVYILSLPEPVNNLEELDPKKFGIIVKNNPFTYPDQENVFFDNESPYKTGLLLPDLEGVDTVEQQLFIACQKAGIDPSKEKFLIYKFTVEKYQ